MSKGRAVETREGKRPKTIEEVVQYALGHKIRVHILILLNEGVYTAVEIAQILDEQLNNVSNHLSKMLEDGAIEIAHEMKRGNLIQYAYKSVGVACFSQTEAEEMTQLQRQMTAGAVYQSGTAEVLAALYAGKLADPRAVVHWRGYQVDDQGRKDMEAEHRRYLERLLQIEVDSVNRYAGSGEEPTAMLVRLDAFERVRKPLSSPNDERSSRDD